jgi:signal transduction histidine kinase
MKTNENRTNGWVSTLSNQKFFNLNRLRSSFPQLQSPPSAGTSADPADTDRKAAWEQEAKAGIVLQAKEEERVRIGHELHDNVNQILSSGQLYLSMLDPGSDDFTEIKAKTMEILLLAIEEVRQLSKSMVTPGLKEGGLVTSVKELINELRFVKLFNIAFNHSDPDIIESLSQVKKLSIFRIIQEQSKNIVKYSKARNVEISIHCIDGQVKLQVKDDGIGFDPQRVPNGLGLSGIHERARHCGGRDMLQTAPGKGCILTVAIPFD